MNDLAKKPVLRAERIHVVYDEKRWKLLWGLRRKAAKIMHVLESFSLHCIVHGSIARGDVTAKSDIDIFILNPPSSFMVETALEKAGIPINRRIIVQATPSYAVKAYIEIEEKVSVSFPLVKLRPLEREFYKFGGEINLQMLKENRRVPGVDKRLMLIEPTEDGHVESSVIGREEHVAKLLKLSTDIVLDRVHALTRRDKVGRTGVFLERELAPEENFEAFLKGLADKNPAIRRRIRFSEK